MLKILLTLALIFNINCIVLSQNGWVWQNPLPQGNDMSVLQFVNATTAFALCYNSVMKSTDAGNTWNIYYTMQSQNNASMHFVNETTGFIVCDTGIVIKTTNGGANWNSIYNFNQKKFHKVYFIDINTGYTLRYNDYFSYLGTTLYKTTNSGLNWNLILYDTLNTMRGISFPDIQNGYLAGYGKSNSPSIDYARVYKTFNGGQTWDTIPTLVYSKFYDCKFISQNTGFVFGERIFTTNKALYSTTNGGANWLPSDMNAIVYSFSFVNSNSIFLISSNNSLHRSSNNGTNWLLTSSIPGSIGFTSLHFIDNSTGIIVGYNGSILKTSNAGLNWTNQYTTLANWLWGVDFVNSNTGYAVDDGHLLKTTNAGNNWNSVFNHALYHLDFVNANTGYCGGVDSLFKTTNGGITFTQVHYSNAPGVLNEIQFLNANTGFVLGKNNITWKTTNGGVNWNILSGYGSGYHECLYFYNDSLGFLGRDDYTLGWGVSRTTNGGVNWDFQTFPTVNYYIYDFYFTSVNTGFFVSGGQIFKTTNSGNNWFHVFDQQSVYLPEIWSIYFVNYEVGYTTYGSKILKTTNAGNNWVVHNSITNYGFFDVYFTDVNTGYFVGNGGVILKTTNGCGDPIGIQPISNNIPNKFVLHQNYPNPFNPATKIKFSIPANRDGKVSATIITIYDILGKEIAVPVNELLSPGEYEIDWDASAYSSGIYFYLLQNGDFSLSRKMLLIK